MSYGDLLAQESEGDNEAPASSPLGALEVVPALASGTYGQVDALANQGLLRLLGGSPQFASQQANRIQAEDTYQPRTEWGRRALNLLSNTFEGAANSAPVAAIADPLTRGLLNMGMQPGDIQGLTGAAGLLLAPEAARVGGTIADSVKSAAGDFARGAGQSVSRILPEYPLAPAGTRYTEIGSQPIKQMTPDEFLSRARPLELDEASRDNIDALKEHIQSGGELDPLQLFANGKEDGRHRAYAAKELGIPTVPVADYRVASEQTAPRSSAPFPQYAEQYPPVPEPVLQTDPKSGKQYLGKGSSPETEDFMKTRQLIQRDINAGHYTPYFDVSQRFDADPSKYPAPGNTLTDTLPKKQVTIDKHTAAIDTPEARQRLNDAFDAGVQSGGHDRWYQMGQLEREFIDELGPEAGRAAFKAKFADAMAATTGGADPTSNLLMASYGNHLAATGQAIPDAAYKMPVPIGGRYVTGNMAQYGGLLDRGEIPVTNEKRFDFSRNFLGDRGPATIDEQMTDLMTPGKNAPAAGQYGIYEKALGDAAAARGLDPRDFQDVAWGGKKSLATGGKYQGKPMIQIVNEAIERTSRLTGLSPRDVVRRGLIRGQIPVYGLAGLGVGANLLNGGNDE